MSDEMMITAPIDVRASLLDVTRQIDRLLTETRAWPTAAWRREHGERYERLDAERRQLLRMLDRRIG